MTTPRIGLKSARGWLRGDRAWIVGFLTVAVLFFFFNVTLINNTWTPEISKFADTWFPLANINQALVYVMCALGLNIVVGYAGLLDLGFVAFWSIGGFVGAWLMSSFFNSANINIGGTPAPFTTGGIHIHWTLVIVVAAAVCAVFGFIIGAPTLRLRSDYLALVTLGFGEIIPEFFKNGERFGPGGKWNLSNGDKGISPTDPIRGLGFDATTGFQWRDLRPTDNLGRYIWFVLLVAVVVFISLRIRSGRLGRAWLAIREDELAASAMGIPLMRTKLAAYAVGAVSGAIGGVAYTMHIQGVYAGQFDFSISIVLLAMVVLGGMGNVWGVMIGALLLSWFNSTGLREGSNAWNEATGMNVNFTSHTFLIFGATLVLMMLFRREGIIPEARTRLVLREPGRTEAESLGGDLEQQAPELEAALGHSVEGSSIDAPVDGDEGGKR